MKKCPKCGNEQEGKNQCQNCGFLEKEEKDYWLFRISWYCAWFIGTLFIIFGLFNIFGGIFGSSFFAILFGFLFSILGIWLVKWTKKLWKTKEKSEMMKKPEYVAQDAIDTEYVTQSTIDTEKVKSKVDQKSNVKKLFRRVYIPFLIGAGLLILIASIIVYVNYLKVDREKFENLYRAGKTIGGATSVGVNYQKFGELLQNLATEISIASDKAKSENEKKLIESYREVLSIYNDSYLLWKYKFETPESVTSKNLIMIKPDLINDKQNMKYIVKRYSLELHTGTVKLKGLLEWVDFEGVPEDSIQKIWLVAKRLLDDTNKKYLGY
jgi:hypothetical protein